MYLLLSGIAKMLGLLSFATLERLAAVVTFLFFDIFRVRRKLILRNLSIAFGDDYSASQKVTIGRHAFSNFIQSIFESFICRKYAIDADVQVEHGEILETEMAKEQGVYFLLCHMGNWEAMGAFVSHRFRPSYTATKKIGSKGINRYVEDMRVNNDMHCIKREKKGDGVRQMKEILGRGEFVGFVMDQARPGEPRLPFFSRDAKTNTSLAAIWQKNPAPIIPAYFYRRAFGKHTLVFNPPLTLQVSDDPTVDILENSKLFNLEVEKIVRHKPEHYFWFHNRWK